MYLTVRYIFVTCFAQVPNKIHIFSWKEARSAQESRKIPPSVFKLTHNSWHKYMPYINQQMPLDLSSALISTIGYSRQRGKYSSIIIMFCTIREEYLDLLSQVYKLHIYWCGGGMSENLYIWLNLDRKLVFLHIFNATWHILSKIWHILT